MFLRLACVYSNSSESKATFSRYPEQGLRLAVYLFPFIFMFRHLLLLNSEESLNSGCHIWCHRNKFPPDDITKGQIQTSKPMSLAGRTEPSLPMQALC